MPGGGEYERASLVRALLHSRPHCCLCNMTASPLPLSLLFATILIGSLLSAVGAQEQDTRPADGADISAINNLSNYDKPQINIDPKLRRALLRVLNKLEEEDNKRSKEQTQHSDTQNVVSEEDFVKYFQNHDTTKEFFDDIGIPKETNHQQHQQQDQQEYDQQQYHPQHQYEKDEQQETQQQNSEYNHEEILSFSTQDDVKDEKDYYNAPPTSPPEDEHQYHLNHQDSSVPTPTTQDFQNPDKYPSTIPTPNRDTLYFQIPEPITLPDPTEENHNATDTLNDQETRSVQHQAPAMAGARNSLSDNDNDKVHFVKTDVSVKLGGFRPTPVTGPVTAEDKQTTRSNSTTKKVKLEKHEVEFLQAPLLTAFTVQQDELGVPRRVIPLNYQSSGPIVLPKNIDNKNKESEQQQQQSTRQSELDVKQRLLDQQLKFLQEQQLRQQEYFKIQEFKLKQQRFLEEEKQKQILLLNQQRELENLQRSILQRQRQQDLLLGKHQQVDNQPLDQEQQRFSLLQQPRLPTFQQQNQHQQLAQLQQEHPPPLPVSQKSVEFQRSVDFQFRPPFPVTLPSTNFQSNFNHFQQNLNNFQSQFLQPTPSSSSSSVELNRINRKEPSSFVGNLGLNQPVSVDSRLQNLFYQSGLTRDLRGGAQEDLNIVTKVLALDHHGRSHQHQFQQSSRFPLPLGQFQAASAIVEHKVEAPSTLITPPPEKL